MPKISILSRNSQSVIKRSKYPLQHIFDVSLTLKTETWHSFGRSMFYEKNESRNMVGRNVSVLLYR